MLFNSEDYQDTVRDWLSEIHPGNQPAYAIGLIRSIVDHTEIFTDEEARERVNDVLVALCQVNGIYRKSIPYIGTSYEFQGEVGE